MEFSFNIFQSRKQLAVVSNLSLKKILVIHSDLPVLGQMPRPGPSICGISCNYQDVKVLYMPLAWLCPLLSVKFWGLNPHH